MDFINHPDLNRIIDTALAEDIGDGDHTTLATIDADYQKSAKAIIKGDGVLAGISFAKKIFDAVDPSLKMNIFLTDGTKVKKGDIAFEVSGSGRSILMAERLVLNSMQRMSGIASLTNRCVEIVKGTGCTLLDTRKTTPCIRVLEKWAVQIGGGQNHRFGLYDMILIKDNHVDYSGGIANALHKTFEYLKKTGKQLKIEIETRNLEEVKQVLEVGGVDVIMLDNMSAELMKEAVQLINKRFKVEASGNITFENLREKAESGVDYISMGALTHSFNSLDISLKASK